MFDGVAGDLDNSRRRFLDWLAPQIRDARVVEAFARVPRECFVPEQWRSQAYSDNPLPIGGNQTISQPLMVALQTESLQLRPGDRVLDLGCGAGTDSLVAAQMVAPDGKVTGIDMTPEMLAKARAAAREMGAENVEFVEGEIEQLPFPDETFDVIVSNGVIDLVPDKDAVFSEIWRVLRAGGRLQIADVTIRRPVSEEGRRNIDLWTG